MEDIHTSAAAHHVVQSLAEGEHWSFHSAAAAVNHHINITQYTGLSTQLEYTHSVIMNFITGRPRHGRTRPPPPPQ